MDISICRSFVLKQVSFTVNNLSVVYFGIGVFYLEGEGVMAVHRSKPDGNGSKLP